LNNFWLVVIGNLHSCPLGYVPNAQAVRDPINWQIIWFRSLSWL